MNDDSRYLFILEIDKRPVGQVRLEKLGEFNQIVSYIISYSIERQYRGRGYGKKIIAMAENKISEMTNKKIELVAEVKYDNTASNMIFKSLGYSVADNDDKIIYKKLLN